MGDRGNLVIRQTGKQIDDIWLYTHWSGSNIKEAAQTALKSGKGRWSDPSYFSKIALHALTDGDISGETGYGISTTIQDNEHPIVVIDLSAQRVHIVSESSLTDGRLPDDSIPSEKEYTFDEFIAAKFKE